MLKAVFKNPQAVVGLFIIFVVLLTAVFAPWIATQDPNAINPIDKFSPSSSAYPLGTDQLGRCIFSRLVFGARYSLFIAIPILICLVGISMTLGVLSAYFGGLFDKILIVICTVFIAFPPLVIVMSLIGSLGQGAVNISIAIIVSMWVWFVRVIRTFTLEQKRREYVTAAKISGCGHFKIITKHILPNIAPSLIVYFSTGVSSIILMISGFAFLGIGMETGIPEWGAMLNDGRTFIYSRPYMLLYPGLCILFTAAGFNLFGETLRDIISKEEM